VSWIIISLLLQVGKRSTQQTRRVPSPSHPIKPSASNSLEAFAEAKGRKMGGREPEEVEFDASGGFPFRTWGCLDSTAGDFKNERLVYLGSLTMQP
jgi:hypothetical protein